MPNIRETFFKLSIFSKIIAKWQYVSKHAGLTDSHKNFLSFYLNITHENMLFAETKRKIFRKFQ